MKRLGSKNLKVAKKKCWSAFSNYIRTKECYETTGSPWSGICVTCNREYDFNELQAGHFLASRCNSILFVEEGVHIQCKSCNLFKSGNIENYYPYMLKRYGQEEIDRLKELKGTTKKFTIEYLDDLTAEYKSKLLLLE
jgi:hypothetical protein